MRAMPFITLSTDIDTEAVAQSVLSMRDKWTSRSDYFPFFTLGRCAYLDGGSKAYYENLPAENAMMVNEFSSLYSEVIKVLTGLFVEDIKLTTTNRVPGFHIFPSDKKSLGIAGGWHKDEPHTTLGLDDIDSYAFTLAISLPKSGGGMDFIDEHNQTQYFAYNEQDLLVHNGKGTHRIAGVKEYAPDEHRITLQGHIIRRNGLLELFF